MIRFDRHQADLAALSKRFFEGSMKSRMRHPTLPPSGDVRITAFNKAQNLIDAISLGLGFRQHILSKPGFFSPDVPGQDVKIIVSQFESLLHLALDQGLFSAMESSLRAVLRTLKPGAAKNGNAPFKGVAGCLLTELDLRKWFPVLDLCREVRNTVHNNSVYYPEDGESKSLQFEGRTYVFTVGERIPFTTWEFSVMLGERQEALLEEVMLHPSLESFALIDDAGPRIPV